MKKKTIYVAIAAIMFSTSCQKEKLIHENEIGQSNSTEAKNEKRIGLASFDPNSASNDELIIEIEDFKTQLENGSLENLNIGDASWYTEALLNYELADAENVIETHIKKFEYSVNVSNGKVNSSVLSTLHSDIVTDIENYRGTLESHLQKILVVDIIGSEIGSTFNFIASVTFIDGSVNSVTDANFDCSFSRNCAPNGQCIFRNSSSTGNDVCGTGRGSNDWLRLFSNWEIGSQYSSQTTGGSGFNSWVNVPICGNQIYGKIFYVGVKDYYVEDNNTHTPNATANHPAAYPLQCLSREWTNYQVPAVITVKNGCVSRNEILYYKNKAVNKARSVSFYNAQSINHNNRIIQFMYGECSVYYTRVWQNVTAQYGKCVYRNLDQQ